MTTAIVVTGHRTNPFDLEGSFTVNFNARDFNEKTSSAPVSSRDITLSVEMCDTVIPSIRVRLARESDGLQLEQVMMCPPMIRKFQPVTAHFTAPVKPGPLGRFTASLFWDGAEGLLLARWIVPRPKERSELVDQFGGAQSSEVGAS